MLINSEENISE